MTEKLSKKQEAMAELHTSEVCERLEKKRGLDDWVVTWMSPGTNGCVLCVWEACVRSL